MAKTRTSFSKGNPGGGRPKGCTNKFTKTVKETVLSVFNDLQDDPKNNLMKFAQAHPRDFYQIASKLIPSEIEAKVEAIATLTITRKVLHGRGDKRN